MIILLNHKDCGFDTIQQEPPQYARAPILQGAASYFARSDSQEIVIQEYAGENYVVQHQLAFFQQPFLLKGIIRNEGLYFSTLLQNSIRKRVAPFGSLHIRENQFACYYTHNSPFEIRAAAEQWYRAFSLFYSPQLLESIAPYFPLLNEKLKSNTPFLLNFRSKFLLPSVKGIIQELFSVNLSEHSRALFYDIKIREILYHLLENTFLPDEGINKFSNWELARIREAARILRNHLDKKPPTIRQLSKMVALNEFKLKKGFQYVFHLPIAEWIQEEKLMYAKECILNSPLPVKQIAAQVGYSRITNFITAFRKKFGYTPGSLRR